MENNYDDELKKALEESLLEGDLELQKVLLESSLKKAKNTEENDKKLDDNLEVQAVIYESMKKNIPNNEIDNRAINIEQDDLELQEMLLESLKISEKPLKSSLLQKKMNLDSNECLVEDLKLKDACKAYNLNKVLNTKKDWLSDAIDKKEILSNYSSYNEDGRYVTEFLRILSSLSSSPPTIKSSCQHFDLNEFVLNKAIEKIQPLKAKYPDISPDALSAISLYTSNEIYNIFNGKCRDYNLKCFSEYHCLLLNGLSGLKKFGIGEYARVYRGLIIPEAKLNLYKKGNKVMWMSNTSSSAEEEIALRFSNTSSSQMKKVCFVIDTKTGRNIEEFSFFEEKEILIPSFAAFIVEKEEKIGDVTKVFLKEINPGYGHKVLLWLDDHPEYQENQEIVQNAEKSFVTVVSFKENKDAISYLCDFPHLMMRGLNEFRVMTDLNCHNLKSEGLNFVEFLRKEMLYPEKIMVFTSFESKKKVERKEIKVDQDVAVTDDPFEAQKFACFQDL